MCSTECRLTIKVNFSIKMDAIQTYHSSDSDEEDYNINARSEITASGTCSAKPKLKVKEDKDTGENQGVISSSHCHTESGLSLPRVRGYGAYMHLQRPTEREPPNASIYGETKRKRMSNSSQSQHRKHVPGCKTLNRDIHGQGKIDLQRHPPPLHYDKSYNDRGQHTIGLDILKYGYPDDAKSRLLGNKDHPQESQSHFKNEQKKDSALKPYVPKRLRKNDRKEDSGKHSQNQASSSNIFTTDPYITAQGLQPRSSCKPPKNIFCTFDLHEGPVTHIQWNVPQLSHLLLSSSLDKTVRVWDYSTLKRCVRTLCCHEGAVKDAQWSSDGRQILSGGFDKTARLTDVQSGTTFQVFDHPAYVTCLKWHPRDPQLFLSGTYGSTVYCWDTRTGGIAHQYSGKLGQILALEFINEGAAFVASCDTVSRDSADRTIMVWDTHTAAVLSNQLYHEKYTCPCLRAHPTENVFLAQSNANYIALFSTQPPYRLNKYQRFEGHQVEGYSIGFDISPDGSLVATGSSDGKTYLYKYQTGLSIRTLEGVRDAPCTDVAWHPIMPSVLASSTWEGKVNIWR